MVALPQFAERAGYEVVDTFTEIVSAAKTSTKDRVERVKVIELARHRQIDVILVNELTRRGAVRKTWWTRSMTLRCGV